jgi:glycosyltransferase involved in cell wall biosynthesis
MIPRKRVYELILSFYELTRTRNGFHLHVAGGKRPLFADYYEALHALVERLSLQDRVTFYGDVTNPSEWYQNIDVFVSNSYSEGLQVSPMEAIASGCYCLSHWWQGAEELLPEHDLCLTDRELMDKLLDYCNAGEAVRAAMRERQRSIVTERFDIERTKVQIRRLVEEVGASRGEG